MLLAYAEFPDPRLCFNIGRLYHQVGETRSAIVHYRKFLDSGAEQDPKRLTKAQSFLEQAENESKPLPLVSAPLPGPGTLPSKERSTSEAAIQVAPATDKPQSTHPNFRIKLGLAFLGGGVLASISGVALITQNTACPSSFTTSGDCAQAPKTSQVGTAFLSIGILFTLGGMITAAIPTRRNAPAVANWLMPARMPMAAH